MTPEAISAILDLGASGLLVLGLFGFFSGKVRTERELKEVRGDAADRLLEMRQDRDAWRSVAESFGGKVEALTDAIVALTGKQIE
jgi:hypothetical protein